MTPKEMLKRLHLEGVSATNEYINDVNGHFGWQIDDNILTVTLEREGRKEQASWFLSFQHGLFEELPL